jgi:hypothetical protein
MGEAQHISEILPDLMRGIGRRREQTRRRSAEALRNRGCFIGAVADYQRWQKARA